MNGTEAEPAANVQVFVNGAARGPLAVAVDSGLWFVTNLAPALAGGDTITARQTVNGVQSDLSGAVVVTAVNKVPIVSAGPSQAIVLPGRIVVGHDVNTLGTSVAGTNEAAFAVNLAQWLTGVTSGTILAVESAPGDGTRDYAAVVKAALASAGFAVTYVSDPTAVSALTLADLQLDDAVFVGITWPTVASISSSVLTQYVNNGGNVYMYGGVDGSASSEAPFLNLFLTAFGLAFDASNYNGLNSINVTSSHPIFSGLTGRTLNSGNGQDIHDLGTNPNASIIQLQGPHGVYAIVNPVVSLTLNGSFNDDGLPTSTTLTASWSEITGPIGSAPVVFSPPSFSAPNAAGVVSPATTTATFRAVGPYVLRLTATDSQLIGSSDVTILVSPRQTSAIAVNAGPSQSVPESWQFFVTDYTKPNVSRYDGISGAFVSTFVPSGSGGLNVHATNALFGPDGNLYIGNWANNSILRYNGATGDFIDVFVAPGAGGLRSPQGMLFGPDGNFYATDGRDTVLRFNGTTGGFIDAFVPSGSGGLAGAFGFVFGPDGNLYVSSYTASSVLRYNGHTGAFLGVFASGNGLVHADDMVFGPDGNLYVSGVTSQNVVRYNGQTGDFIDVFVPTGSGGLSYPGLLTFGPDGNLYVQNFVADGNILRYSGTVTVQGAVQLKAIGVPSDA